MIGFSAFSCNGHTYLGQHRPQNQPQWWDCPHQGFPLCLQDLHAAVRAVGVWPRQMRCWILILLCLYSPKFKQSPVAVYCTVAEWMHLGLYPTPTWALHTLLYTPTWALYTLLYTQEHTHPDTPVRQKMSLTADTHRHHSPWSYSHSATSYWTPTTRPAPGWTR